VSAGIDATLEVPLRDQGVLRLPGLGLLRLGGEAAPTATVTVDKQGFTVESGPVWHRVERPAPGPAPTDAEGRWEPRPQWTLAASGDALPWTVALEDRDPERALDCWQAAEPGDARDTAGWGEALQAAWELVCRELPGYAEGLRQGLTAVTPLRPSPDGRAVSAAARDAFGVVGAALPPAPEQLALLLVHEFQHVKLGAVFDLHDLFDRQDPRRYRAPWRPDLRPFEGLFQGAYAHIAVVEFWRARHRSLSDEGRTEQAEHAWEQFTTWLGHTHEAILVMAGSGTLTPSGERFVAAMRATVEPWVREAGSRSAADAVARRSGG
jgi:uncharacterized protein